MLFSTLCVLCKNNSTHKPNVSQNVLFFNMYAQQLLCFKALITVHVGKAENASLLNHANVYTMAVGL
jgi:hypothetical protein